MEECIDPTNQDVGCVPTNGTCGGPRQPTETNGMIQFLHHGGLCLEGNLTDLLMHTARCNISVRNQRFATFNVPGPVAGGVLLAMNPEHENKITYCITGNCTIINATAIDCTPRARIGLAPCVVGTWPGSTLPGMYDPRQLWTAVSAVPMYPLSPNPLPSANGNTHPIQYAQKACGICGWGMACLLANLRISCCCRWYRERARMATCGSWRTLGTPKITPKNVPP